MQIKIISWEKIADNMFKVVADCTACNEETDLKAYQDAVDTELGFGWKVKENIAKRTGPNGRCYVRLLLEVVPDEVSATEDEELKRFDNITASLYRDKGDNSLWKVEKASDGSEKLVREDILDGEQVLRDKVNFECNNTTNELLNPEAYEGDYVSYISEDGDVKEGFVENEDDHSAQYVVDLNGNKEEIISASQYLSVVASTDKVFASFQIPTGTADEAMSEIEKYYSDKDFMKKVKEVLGDEKLVPEDDAVLVMLTTKLKASKIEDKKVANILANITRASENELDWIVENSNGDEVNMIAIGTDNENLNSILDSQDGNYDVEVVSEDIPVVDEEMTEELDEDSEDNELEEEYEDDNF